MGRSYTGFKGDIHEGLVYRGSSTRNRFRKVLKITKLHPQIWRIDYSVCDEKGIPFGKKKRFCSYADFQMWAREEMKK